MESGLSGVSARPDETPPPPCGDARRTDNHASHRATCSGVFVDGK